MYLIVGLGNPENEYSNTRHNMGFDVINEIAKKYNIKVIKEKFNGLYETVIIQNQKVILLKPQTYMNLSGKCLKEIVDFYNIENENIIVIYDDIDTDKGKIRIRKKGGPGTRIRVGIGQPEFKNDMINYVIGNIPEEEKIVLQQGVKKAVDAIEEILKNGVDIAMNKFN